MLLGHKERTSLSHRVFATFTRDHVLSSWIDDLSIIRRNSLLQPLRLVRLCLKKSFGSDIPFICQHGVPGQIYSLVFWRFMIKDQRGLLGWFMKIIIGIVYPHLHAQHLLQSLGGLTRRDLGPQDISRSLIFFTKRLHTERIHLQALLFLSLLCFSRLYRL